MEILKAEGWSWKSLLSVKGVTAMAVAAATVTGLGTMAVSSSIASSDKIVSGVRFEGRELKGLNTVAAENFFQKEASKKIHALTFTYGDKTFEVTPEDIALTPQTKKAVDEAESYGRGGGAWTNLRDQIRCAMGGREITLTATYNEDLLKQKIDAMAAQINIFMRTELLSVSRALSERNLTPKKSPSL